MVFTGNLKNRREGCRVRVDAMSYPVRDLLASRSVFRALSPYSAKLGITDMLVDQDNTDVLALCGKPFESGFDSSVVRLPVDNKEVLLRIGRGRHMLQEARQRRKTPAQRKGDSHTPIPARSSPVTESCREQVSTPVFVRMAGGLHASSPITAKKCLSLKSACEVAILPAARSDFSREKY